jgi:hypothetical protein
MRKECLIVVRQFLFQLQRTLQKKSKLFNQPNIIFFMKNIGGKKSKVSCIVAFSFERKEAETRFHQVNLSLLLM